MSQASQSAQAAKASEANLEEQLRVLREDLKGLSDAVSSLASHSSDAVRDGVRQKFNETTDRARNAANQARDQAEEAHQRVNGVIEANPTTSVLAAFGVGMLLGMWSRR
ncbi:MULTISPECIES: DUF883 family protein [Thalassobaculum]|uniref:DUF883 domain-containing protein n=1 Tax=Thalassobaculum litoreum DSM 18839 TaxID=1123362 RepID=A0A8G2F098_9PROT|nr:MULTISPECIES: DUF883 family protein [Thalassobaculum]SDG39549.1 protein of unknown function [Thalassobaculum litoreum DSM 18839]